jgi:hypothetical protein
MTNTNDITYIGVDIAKLKFDICLHNGNFSSCVYESLFTDIMHKNKQVRFCGRDKCPYNPLKLRKTLFFENYKVFYELF